MEQKEITKTRLIIYVLMALRTDLSDGNSDVVWQYKGL